MTINTIINITDLQPNFSASLKAVITILNPFPAVPHESVTYLSVTKLVDVLSMPFSPMLEGVSEHDMLA